LEAKTRSGPGPPAFSKRRFHPIFRPALTTTVTSTFFGHPVEMKEEILEQILADKFDVAAFAKAH
jgi:hypothetical protein